MLIGLLVFAVIIGQASKIINEVRDQIDVMEDRQQGANYNLILKDLLKNAQQHRGLTVSVVAGDETVLENREQVQKNMEQAFKNLQDFEQQLHDDFNVKEPSVAIQKQWDEILTTSWTSSAQVIEVHSQLTNDILDMMQIVSNESKLQLAQTKETNNLIMAVTSTMPQVTEQLGTIRATAMNVLNTGKISETQQQQLNEYYFQVNQNTEIIEENIEHAFKDAAIQAALERKYTEGMESLAIYRQHILDLMTNPEYKVEADDFYEIATNAINGQFEVYEASLVHLTERLDNDLQALQTELYSVVFTVVGIILIVIYLFIGLYLAIRRSVQKLVTITTQIADGDLTVHLNLQTKDEMQQVETAVNKMVGNLQGLVIEIAESSQHVAASSEELHAGVEETTSSITYVADSVGLMTEDVKKQTDQMQENTAAMQEMAAGVSSIANNTETIYSLTKTATTYAKDGNETVAVSKEQMAHIQHSVANTSERIISLESRSNEIGQIVTMITAIADQTNLLSLNAAIEAARAGEHGKGFAVVASEVGTLAAQSRNAAAQVANLIQAIQKDTVESVTMMQQVTKDVEQGQKISEQTSEKFAHILESMQTLQSEMAQILTNTQQMSVMTEQVSGTMVQSMELSTANARVAEEISTVTEEQYASMEEMTSSANELTNMALTLQQLIESFKIK